jgi:hypothetical protein
VVFGTRISNRPPGAPQAEGELLFSQPEIGLDFLAQWLDLHYRMTPVPQILGAVIRDEFPTVEAQALSLATAVEALHRTLFPTARRFDVEQIESALAALEKSEIPVAIADTFASARRQYWHDYSYPQRVKALAEPVAQAVPARRRDYRNTPKVPGAQAVHRGPSFVVECGDTQAGHADVRSGAVQRPICPRRSRTAKTELTRPPDALVSRGRPPRAVTPRPR